jgi:hypothetical protein
MYEVVKGQFKNNRFATFKGQPSIKADTVIKERAVQRT